MTVNAEPASTEGIHQTASSGHASAHSIDTDPATEARERAEAAPKFAELQPDIERARQNRARRVDRLARRPDVRGQARNRLEAARDVAARQQQALRNRASDAASAADKGTLGVGSGVFAAVVAVLAVGLWRRNQRPRRRGRRLR